MAQTNSSQKCRHKLTGCLLCSGNRHLQSSSRNMTIRRRGCTASRKQSTSSKNNRHLSSRNLNCSSVNHLEDVGVNCNFKQKVSNIHPNAVNNSLCESNEFPALSNDSAARLDFIRRQRLLKLDNHVENEIENSKHQKTVPTLDLSKVHNSSSSCSVRTALRKPAKAICQPEQPPNSLSRASHCHAEMLTVRSSTSETAASPNNEAYANVSNELPSCVEYANKSANERMDSIINRNASENIVSNGNEDPSDNPCVGENTLSSIYVYENEAITPSELLNTANSIVNDAVDSLTVRDVLSRLTQIVDSLPLGGSHDNTDTGMKINLIREYICNLKNRHFSACNSCSTPPDVDIQDNRTRNNRNLNTTGNSWRCNENGCCQNSRQLESFQDRFQRNILSHRRNAIHVHSYNGCHHCHGHNTCPYTRGGVETSLAQRRNSADQRRPSYLRIVNDNCAVHGNRNRRIDESQDIHVFRERSRNPRGALCMYDVPSTAAYSPLISRSGRNSFCDSNNTNNVVPRTPLNSRNNSTFQTEENNALLDDTIGQIRSQYDAQTFRDYDRQQRIRLASRHMYWVNQMARNVQDLNTSPENVSPRSTPVTYRHHVAAGTPSRRREEDTSVYTLIHGPATSPVEESRAARILNRSHTNRSFGDVYRPRITHFLNSQRSRNIITNDADDWDIRDFTRPRNIPLCNVSEFPTAQFDSSRSRTLNADCKFCSICYEDYQHNDEQRYLPCTHAFHVRCIDNWLRESTLCPICKHNVATIAAPAT